MAVNADLSEALVMKNVGEAEFDKQYSDQAQYGRIHFWDEWYTNEPEPFEWYYPYKKFAGVINDHVAKEAKSLYAGCGNSYFLEDMVKDGFIDVVGVDFSRVVIDMLKVRYNFSPYSCLLLIFQL